MAAVRQLCSQRLSQQITFKGLAMLDGNQISSSGKIECCSHPCWPDVNDLVKDLHV